MTVVSSELFLISYKSSPNLIIFESFFNTCLEKKSNPILTPVFILTLVLGRFWLVYWFQFNVFLILASVGNNLPPHFDWFWFEQRTKLNQLWYFDIFKLGMWYLYSSLKCLQKKSVKLLSGQAFLLQGDDIFWENQLNQTIGGIPQTQYYDISNRVTDTYEFWQK